MAVAISIQPIVAIGDDIIIVFLRPTHCSRKPAKILPQNAPLGGIEPARKNQWKFISIYDVAYVHRGVHSALALLAHDAMSFVGSRSGLQSRIDGMAGAE